MCIYVRVCDCVYMRVCVCLRVCEPFPVCSVQELNDCKRSMVEVVAVSTQAYGTPVLKFSYHPTLPASTVKYCVHICMNACVFTL